MASTRGIGEDHPLRDVQAQPGLADGATSPESNAMPDNFADGSPELNRSQNARPQGNNDIDLEDYKTVTYWQGLCLLLSRQIGAGIFSSPATVNRNAGSVAGSLLIWLSTGGVAWAGAGFPLQSLFDFVASYAELGCFLPFTGGAYLYLQHLYGPLAGFLYSWTLITAVNPGSTAVVSIIFSDYVDRTLALAFHKDQIFVSELRKILGLACIWMVVYFNIKGTSYGTAINSIFTIIKVTSLGSICAVGIAVWGKFHISRRLI
jgi:amino acid transporter